MITGWSIGFHHTEPFRKGETAADFLFQDKALNNLNLSVAFSLDIIPTRDHRASFSASSLHACVVTEARAALWRPHVEL